MNKYFNIAIVTALSVAITSFKGNAMSDLSQYVDPFTGALCTFWYGKGGS